MSSHPDADAFMRTYLRNPPDATARLVFADWLEETGTPSNVAWAHYIRVKAEADHCEFGTPGRNRLEHRAAGYAPEIEARLTIPARLFVGYPRSLLQLLPPQNVTVRLEGFAIPPAVIELMPESVARENLVLPLDQQGRALLVVAATPENVDTVQKLEFILGKAVVAVHGDADDIQATIDRDYGTGDYESVDCISYESPLIGLQGDPESGSIFGIFLTAFSEGASGLELRREGGTCSVRYIRTGEQLATEDYDGRVYRRLLDHLLSQIPEAEYIKDGLRCLDLDVPLLSGRPFPVSLQRKAAAPGERWFRLRFR